MSPLWYYLILKLTIHVTKAFQNVSNTSDPINFSGKDPVRKLKMIVEIYMIEM